LFRGLALWLIFLDHIPSNLVAWVTIRNYGFSDATEIFVFVSGYTAAFVYGKEMNERGFVVAGAHILRRAWQIYVAHVFLFAIYLAEISYVATSFGTRSTPRNEHPRFPQAAGRDDCPGAAAQVQAGHMDVLPLYIILLLLFRRSSGCCNGKATLALGASVVLYVLTGNQLEHAELPERALVLQPVRLAIAVRVRSLVRAGGAQRLSGVLRSPVAVGSLSHTLYSRSSSRCPGTCRHEPICAALARRGDLSDRQGQP